MSVISRRTFLQGATLSAATLAWPGWMPRMAFVPAQRPPRGDVMVVIFLRGAADALNMVVPHGEKSYYVLRPTLSIPRPDDRRAPVVQRVVNLDGFFGLHPSLAPLLPAWHDKRLAFVHACGAPDESRSHFQAMELMERGVDEPTGPASGWIGRHMATLDNGNTSPLRAIGLGERVPRSLQGGIPATALRSIADFHLAGDPRAVARMRASLEALYGADNAADDSGTQTLELLSTLGKLESSRYAASHDARFPESNLGLGLQQVAMLVKAEVGLEVACLDAGGWDTHVAQGGSEGQMARLLADLGEALGALYADLSDHMDKLTVVTLSEFGRRAQENGGLGTDHGHGSLITLMGSAVVGGRVHGTWPGMQDDQLVGPGDLAVTTDYRDVLGEVVQKRLGNAALGDVFPGYTPIMRGVCV